MAIRGVGGAGRLNPVEIVSVCWALKGDHEPQHPANLNNPSPSSSHRALDRLHIRFHCVPPRLEEETAYGGKPLPYSRERYLALARTAAAQVNWDVLRRGLRGPLEDDARRLICGVIARGIGVNVDLIFASPAAEVQCRVNESGGPGSRHG